MGLSIRPIPILTDNYAWFLRDEESGATALVDPAEEAPLVAAIEAEGGRLDQIFLTHHHADHVVATDALRKRFGAIVTGAAADAYRLPMLDYAVSDGDTVALGDMIGTVMETPGHTRGHIAYYFAAAPALFCGDTLFSLGCGRLFEGSAEEMFHALHRIAALPDSTLVCCGHEYTLANTRFALAVDPDNAALHARVAEINTLRAEARPTVPVRLGLEKQTNPFLRAPDVATFARLRREKDVFR
ncbi:hydroxyacylglutathione hydrolase [Nguyenibacter vanlangensis]|uniref:Hydroxyacylglutathione hydrolase n=1 Tax=Nguyenibacter vanlangensis TaxID=1216886 RepID=A0A7Y7IZR3_9PROT|nr:hydroxyacylglutathione hydrolase [Nguyenibacter vanlangensis]NVN13262.1 hydroxyacylglutathione hydrolase [Nguyenibacter vanlangensis]